MKKKKSFNSYVCLLIMYGIKQVNRMYVGLLRVPAALSRPGSQRRQRSDFRVVTEWYQSPRFIWSDLECRAHRCYRKVKHNRKSCPLGQDVESCLECKYVCHEICYDYDVYMMWVHVFPHEPSDANVLLSVLFFSKQNARNSSISQIDQSTTGG